MSVRMWCLVSLSNAVNLDIEVDAKAKGQECLDQVCNKLGIIEEDYFGLQYRCPREEVLWLNMRNPIRQQVPGPLPYRLHLRVKFFVPPHLILQENTRRQFYLHVKSDLQTGRLKPAAHELAPLLAYIAQAEFGDYHKSPVVAHSTNDVHARYETFLDQNNAQIESAFWDAVVQAHKKLATWSRTKAEYWLLKEASALKCYGEEVFLAKMTAGELVQVGVGPDGVNISNADSRDLIQSIPYQCIHMATHTGKCFFLTFMAEGSSGGGGTANEVSSQTLELKFDGSKSANSVYRAITEKHAFYSCETVRRSVTTQFIRDLKGTIISLFNENTALGKNYVFDVRRTCREVHDDARRTLYRTDRCRLQAGNNWRRKKDAAEDASDDRAENEEEEEEDAASRFGSKRRKSLSFTDDDEMEDPDHCCMEFEVDEDAGCKRPACMAARERLDSFEDALLCRICMDADISTAFFPCRHVACCDTCAGMCDRCPLCRASIECTQFVYLPFQNNKAGAT